MIRQMFREAFETFCIVVYLSLPIIAIVVAFPLGHFAAMYAMHLLRK